MFWRFGGYTNISTIDTILERDNFQLEDLLNESDLIQELKQHNAKLVEYLREPPVLGKLLDYVIAPRPESPAAENDHTAEEEEAEGKGKGVALPSRPRASSSTTDSGEENDAEAIEKKRNRYAFVSAEILSSDNWSIYEALMESKDLLQKFWQFLKRPVPLDNLQASYFTKVNESLFDKKTDDMLAFIRSLDGAVADILKHVDCPNIMDLLLRIISLERTESGQGTVEWLYTQDVVPTLLSFLGPEHAWSTQTSAGDFLKAIITVSANASQNEQTCIGPNELTRQLVSKPCVEQLIKFMLGGGNPLTCGVGIIIEVIRKNNSDYDPDGAEPNSIPSSRDPIYLGTLLRLFAQHIPDFMNLILNGPNQKDSMLTTSGQTIKPLGFDRFKTCELMAELLHCSNMGLLNEVGAEEVIAARDAHRQRLREEGRLHPLRVEDAPSSTEDLTMRMSQSSHAVERRLGVTNVPEDDGFEEVTDPHDDDSSHGVEELPEVPTSSSTSSFLDKDDDDFVDEPLSSPRLNTRELEPRDAQQEDSPIDERELAPRPLSPTKRAVEEEEDPSEEDLLSKELAETSLAPEAKEASEKTSEESQPSVAEPEKKEAVEATPSTEITPPSEAHAVAEASDKVKVTVEPVEEKPAAVEGLSPHPEDTPPPLFSGQENPGAGAAPAPASAEASSLPSQEIAPVDSEAEITKQISALEQEVKSSQEKTAEEDTSDSAKSIPPPAPASDPITPIEDDTPISPPPVVGDYLKMQFVKHQVVPTILGFFFKYQWNNFLHNVVYDIVQQVFNGPMDRGYNPTLAISLFEAADITNQIINGQLESEKSEKATKTRMGYMGHLTLIAEEVVKFTERHPPEILGELVLQKVMAQDWVSYVEGPLAETRERDNAILGGVRPDVAMARGGMSAAGLGGAGISGLGSIGLSSGGGSSALAEAGLGGQDASEGGSGGIGPFAISSGTLMSGFGSSSDEDDDDEQDNDDDVANEFRAYTDPLNANTSSMLPPSIPPPPPPPPPLNIPPSRARLQLAARLAMNKRNAAAAANGGEEGTSATSDNAAGLGTFSPPNTSASDRLRNPFADDDDDEDDDHRQDLGSGSGSGSDDDDVENGGRDTGSSWNRGSWWRGVVRTARRGSGRKDTEKETERFGDGRDDETDSEDDAVGDDDIEDEEFGDFAMPETNQGSSTGMVTGIDPARERLLLKPLPVHPSPGGKLSSATSPFTSLWPFSTAVKDTTTAPPSNADQQQASSSEKSSETGGTASTPISEEPVDLADMRTDDDESAAVVVGEDGQKINRAVEATRRTSIEDPDDDEDSQAEKVPGGEEIVVGRPSGDDNWWVIDLDK